MPKRAEPELWVYDSVQRLSKAASEMFIYCAQHATAEKGTFAVALSGGNTPKLMLNMLADTDINARIDWDNILVFQADERYVPAESPYSNSRMLHESLLDKVDIPACNIHTFSVHKPLEECAAAYHQEIIECLGDPPAIDLVVLGIGENGHTASLFPGSTALEIEDRYAAACVVESQIAERLTLTRPAIRNARRVLFLVTGEAKADALVRTVTFAQPLVPAAMVLQEAIEAYLMVDEPALSGLKE